MEIKINPLVTILTLLLIVISLNWYININDVELVIDKEEITLSKNEIKDLIDSGQIDTRYKSLNHVIKKESTLTYYKRKSKIPLIYTKDTVSFSGWKYYEYN